jgi:hypothetical protein
MVIERRWVHIWSWSVGVILASSSGSLAVGVFEYT